MTVIVDVLEAWWARLDHAEQVTMTRLQSNMDNGPESRGRRTPFLHRMVAFCDAIGKPIQLRYSPPYHRTYHPIERCWGILELHWNGTKLVDAETMRRVGQDDDMEGPSSRCRTQPYRSTKRA